MATVIFLPALVPDMTDAKLVRWLVSVGSPVAAGAPLAELTSDGRSYVMAAPVAGIVKRALRSPNDQFPVEGVMAIIGAADEQLGFAHNAVKCCRVQLLLDCLSCGETHPVNGLELRVRCDRCKAVRTLSAEFWVKWVWDYLVDSLPRNVDGTASGSTITGEHGRLQIAAMVVPPLCRKCRQLLVDADTIAPGSAIHCSACGEAHQVRLAPDWLAPKVPRLHRLVGECEPPVDSAAELPPKPVTFQCPTCSAALALDGEKRIVTCQYCNADVYLPADLWAHFHPARRRDPWWWLVAP